MKKALLAVAAVVALSGCTSTMNQEWHRNCTVTDKEMVYSHSSDKHGSSSSRTKRLSTSCGVFDVSDSMAGGYNSYDMWAKLQKDKRYDIKTGGYRSGFSDTFPVVIAIDGPK